MAYKTILAHLFSPESAPAVLNAAVLLAEEHGAHLVCLHTKAYVEPYDVCGTIAAEMPPAICEGRQEDIDQNAAEVRKIFDNLAGATSVVTEWREEEFFRSSFSSIVTRHGKCADLIVMSGGQRDGDFDPWLSMPVNTVMESGRPVLMVPVTGAFTSVGKRPVIAWNETRESARAAFDAIPLLGASEEVRIVSVDTGSMQRWTSPSPGEGLAVALARHDLTSHVEHVTVQNVTVGEELLDRATHNGSDLLVIGCFGHARVREYIFGGVTSHILEHATIPVLMSH